MTRQYSWKRHITGFLAAALAFSMPLNTMGAAIPGPGSAFGAGTGHVLALLQEQEAFDPVFYADTYPDVTAVYGRTPAALEAHYRTFGFYEGRMANAGDLLAWRLRAARLVRRFLDYNRDLYLNGAGDAAFPWFNAGAYLAAYPELREELQAEAAGTGLPYAAVRHYLERGALEGRSSCTSFDPVWAIVARPELAVPRHGDLRPEELAAAFTASEGRNDTGWFAVGTPERILQVINSAAGSAASAGTAASAGSGSSDSGDDSGRRQGVEDLSACTYLLYLCGSDLETNSGDATLSIYNAMYGIYRMPASSRDSLRLLICAGGAKEWASGYMDSWLNGEKKKTAVYTVNPSEVVKRMDALKAGTAEMGLSAAKQQELFTKLDEDGLNIFQGGGDFSRDERKTLADYLFNADTLPLNPVQLSTGAESISEAPVLKAFLSAAKQSAPAENYGICFWDHGGGPNGGACQDEATGKSLYVDEIRSAFKEADMHFSLLCFDCCLMGSTEIAYYLNEYYDYMVASEEITRGGLAYDEMLPILAAGTAGQVESAAREAALKALAARHQVWHGCARDFEAGAVIDARKSEAAAAALNELAGRMLTFMNTGEEAAKKKHQDLVYEALWGTRVRCINFGTEDEATKAGIMDLVDTGDFLTQLRNELKLRESGYSDPDDAVKAFFKDMLGEDKNSGLIGSALSAADALTIANYGVINKNYMYSDGIPGVEKENTWENFRSGTKLTGTSIYVPYFSPGQLYSYRDPKKNPWDSGKSLLFGSGSSYADLMRRFTEYTGLTESGFTDEENKRVDYLKLELIEGKRLKTNDKGEPEKDGKGNYIYTDEKVPGYEELLNIGWVATSGTDKKKKDDHLEISVNQEAYADRNWSSWSRGDAYADLMDTAEAMTVFITRAVEAKLKEQHANEDSSGNAKADNEPVMIDLVIGRHKIRYSATDGGADKIRVFADAIDMGIANMAEGQVARYYDSGDFEDWHTWQELIVPYADVEDFYSKQQAIDALLGVDKDRNLKDYTIFRGGVIMKDEKARVPQDVCLIFGMNKEGSKVYLGASERAVVKNQKTGREEYAFRRIDGIDQIRFDHLMVYNSVDTSRKVVDYAEDFYDLTNPIYYTVSFPDSAPVTLQDPSDENTKSKPGEAKQNKYYLALMPEYGNGNFRNVFVLNKVLYETGEADAAKGEVAAEKPKEEAAEKAKTEVKAAAAAARSAAAEAGAESAAAEAEKAPEAEPAAEEAETASEEAKAESEAEKTEEAPEAEASAEEAEPETEAEKTEEAREAEAAAEEAESETGAEKTEEAREAEAAAEEAEPETETETAEKAPEAEPAAEEAKAETEAEKAEEATEAEAAVEETEAAAEGENAEETP